MLTLRHVMLRYVRVENMHYGVVLTVHARGHVTVRARACVNVRCRTLCELDWKLRLTSADTHLQPTHADPTGGANSAPQTP